MHNIAVHYFLVDKIDRIDPVNTLQKKNLYKKTLHRESENNP